MDYTKRGVIQSGKAVPTSAGVESLVGATVEFSVFGIEVTCMVAATGATHAFKLFDSAGAVLANVVVGGLTAGDSARDEVAVDDSVIAADDYVYVGSITNDASAAYSWRIIGNVAL